jgi:hypothetical protein
LSAVPLIELFYDFEFAIDFLVDDADSKKHQSFQQSKNPQHSVSRLVTIIFESKIYKERRAGIQCVTVCLKLGLFHFISELDTFLFVSNLNLTIFVSIFRITCSTTPMRRLRWLQASFLLRSHCHPRPRRTLQREVREINTFDFIFSFLDIYFMLLWGFFF